MQHSYWGFVILGGYLATVLAQVAAAILAFSTGFGKGFSALLLPGYLFLAIRRSGLYYPVIGLWLTGIFAVVAGTVAMS